MATVKFESLKDTQEIVVYWRGSAYRILGSSLSIWEFVMLMGFEDEKGRNELPSDVRAAVEERLTKLREDPKRRREYEID